MKKPLFLPFVLAFVVLQIDAVAQTKPLVAISCDSSQKMVEKAQQNLEYENVTYVADRNGSENSAIKFDGQTFIKVNKNINPSSMPELTIAFWAKPDFDNKRMTIFSQDNGGYDRSMAIDNRAGGWKWTAYCSKPVGGAEINKSKWSFVAVVFNKKSKQVLIFVDGIISKHHASASDGLEYFHFGNNPSFGEPYFGLLDDIRIYDKALTSSELLSVFKTEGGSIDESDQYFYSDSSDDADILIRVGDIDNLGFGYPDGFDPFAGLNTSVHRFPWETDLNDYRGTDKIMVVSSYKSGYSDGYTSRTQRPGNIPHSIDIEYKKPEVKIGKVVLQMMLDDFQAPRWGTSFQFHINGKRLTYVEDIINKLEQTGPTGKLVQIGLLPEDNKLFSTGKVSIKIDDPITGAGDGFAIDFIQILINPEVEYKLVGDINGIVKDEQGNPIEDVLISANGLKEDLTNAEGTFSLNDVPIGLFTVTANKNLYSSGSLSFELKKGENKQIQFVLKSKSKESEEYVGDELKEKGFVNLYGIYFDSGKTKPNNESEETLEELARFIENNKDLKIMIIGHTDSDGDEKLNKDLSLERAKAIISWLKAKQIDVSNITPKGYGESSPVSSNRTSAGKALNRRVEIRIFNE